MAVGGLLGSSSPGFLGTHSPGTLDLGGPFPVASLWDGRCFVLYPACISGLPLWSSGGDVSGKGCTFRCGWVSDTLRSVVFLFLADTNIKEGELVIFLLFNCKLDLGVLFVEVLVE